MKKKQTSLDRMKEIEFVKKGDEIMMKHLGQELAMYIGKYKFEWAERYFRKPILPKWKMEKVIHLDLPMATKDNQISSLISALNVERYVTAKSSCTTCR